MDKNRNMGCTQSKHCNINNGVLPILKISETLLSTSNNFRPLIFTSENLNKEKCFRPQPIRQKKLVSVYV